MSSSSTIINLRQDFQKIANKDRALISQRFFKTGKGEYGEGDIFIGITVPHSRKIAIQYKNLPFDDIVTLLKSSIHEERLIALLILVHNFQKTDEKSREKIYKFYLKNIKYINNWDLVDLSADKIVGQYLYLKCHPELVSGSHGLPAGKAGMPKLIRHDKLEILIKLAKSKNVWERRIAMIATYYFIRNGKFDETLKIAELLLSDKHDLIQKAVGWMLREVGNRDLAKEEGFLKKHYNNMGRTALRYAIEKFPSELRLSYLNLAIRDFKNTPI